MTADTESQMQQLQLARDRMQALLNGLPDAVFGVDPGGKVVLISPSAASVFGLDTTRLADLTMEQLVPGQGLGDPEARTLEGMYLRSSGVHVARFEADARRVDGTVFPADVSLSRTEIGGVAHYTCVVRDITEQRMNASVLNLYSRALECTTNGVVISDMTLPGQPVFYANPAFYRITGYEPGDAIGRNCAFLQRDDRDQPGLDTLRQAVADGQSASAVLRNYRKDGSLFFNELSIAPVPSGEGRAAHYVGVLNDVTDRERTRLAIAERSARLNAVFDLSPDGFVVFDREGELVYTNRAFVEMTGLDLLADGGGASLTDFDHEFATLGSLSAPCRPVAEVLALAREQDGAVQTLHIERPQHRVLARAVRHQADGAGETILYFRDVTRETEVDRMKSEFLTTAAHELRTPMVSVFGFTELLLRRPVPEARRKDMLETIHRQASLLINMVNELLDLARIEARQGKDLKRERCSLGALVRQAAAAFASQPGGDRLAVAMAHADAEIFVDPEKTHRVFTNVLSNAFKYSPAGGAIEVRTLAGQLAGQPAVGLRVRDHGIGMSPEQLGRVFERFYRADPSGNIPGTGLGMSLVKEITELQGGSVQIDSRPGEGTSVTLWWPCAAPSQTSAEAKAVYQ
jgi:PAS domain S-box-containing protein